MSYSLPFSLSTWIEDHREYLKPPVCNKQVFEQDDFIVMVVGGPNNRTDYHYNETPELFYQIEGEMNLAVVDEGEFKDIPIKAGEIFLLPPKMLHSPQRFAGRHEQCLHVLAAEAAVGHHVFGHGDDAQMFSFF